MPTSVTIALIAAGAAEALTLLGLPAFLALLGGSLVASAVFQQFNKPKQPIDERSLTLTVRQAVAPWLVIYGQARVGGIVTFIENAPPESVQNNAVLNLVITLAGHPVEEIGDIWLNDEVVPFDANGMATGRYAGHVTVYKSLGTEADDVQPFPQLTVESAGKWTDAHRQARRAKIHVRLQWNQDLFPQGIPNISAVVRGKKVYDPRTGTTAWSSNAALCIADYLTDPTLGLGCVYSQEIDNASLVAAANVCDEEVALAAGGTEKRYSCNGAFTTGASPREILERLNTAYAGPTRFLGGRWSFGPAVYATPTVTLTADDLRGPVHILPRRSRRDVANGIKGVFVSPVNNWQPASFPAVAPALYLAEDSNERIWLELDLPFTTSSAAAQRIARIELERLRQQIVLDLPCKLTMYQLQPGDTVMVTLSRYGYSAKVFEVVTSKLVFEADEAQAIRLGTDLVLRETSAAVYAWSTANEQADEAAPDSNLPDPFLVGAPGTPSVSEELYVTSGSAGVKSKATVSWGASNDQFVTAGGYYELEYRPSGGIYQRVSPITSTSRVLEDLAPGFYDFRVRAVNQAGVRSAYSAVSTSEILGLTAPPSSVANFAVQGYSGQAKFTWDKPTALTDLDVVIGGRTFVRWTPKTAGANWQDGSLVNPDGYAGDTTIGFGPLMTGTYMAKHRDSGGNYSAAEASFVVTEALITGMATLATVTEHPAFTGAKVNVAAPGGNLQLEGNTLWDSMLTNIDDWVTIDSLGGIKVTGSYSFASKMDLGSVQNCRLFSTIRSLAFDTGDFWDSRTGNIDDWGLIDGEVIEDADVKLLVRKTDDDPNASPSWGPWHPLGLVADYHARGFDFRLDFTSGNATHNRAVDQLSVAAKQ